MAARKLILAVCIVLVAAFFPGCDGRGSGAPTSACTSMSPGHLNNGTAVTAQSSASPYSIVVGDKYTPGRTLSVQIVGPVFKGFLLQARRPGMTSPVGTFSSPPTDTKAIQCTAADSSMTHANTNPKQNLTLTWTAPSTGVGNVQFVATVAEEKVTYWMNIQSRQVRQASGAIFAQPTFYVIILCLLQSAYVMLK
ncbi:putative defense protein 3 [Branchiostoma floridae x Branchiostoma japonicum]